MVRHDIMPNKKYSRNAEEKVQVVKYAEKHGNTAAAKHYETDESNIRYWRKQKLVLAAMPAKKRRTRLSSARYPEIENRLKTWIVNHGNSGLRLTVKALRLEALSIAETIQETILRPAVCGHTGP